MPKTAVPRLSSVPQRFKDMQEFLNTINDKKITFLEILPATYHPRIDQCTAYLSELFSHLDYGPGHRFNSPDLKYKCGYGRFFRVSANQPFAKDIIACFSSIEKPFKHPVYVLLDKSGKHLGQYKVPNGLSDSDENRFPKDYQWQTNLKALADRMVFADKMVLADKRK